MLSCLDASKRKNEQRERESFIAWYLIMEAQKDIVVLSRVNLGLHAPKSMSIPVKSVHIHPYLYICQ